MNCHGQEGGNTIRHITVTSGSHTMLVVIGDLTIMVGGYGIHFMDMSGTLMIRGDISLTIMAGGIGTIPGDGTGAPVIVGLQHGLDGTGTIIIMPGALSVDGIDPLLL